MNKYDFLPQELFRQTNIDWLPLASSLPGIWTKIRWVCALTGNPTSDLSVHRITPNQLSHTSQVMDTHDLNFKVYFSITLI